MQHVFRNTYDAHLPPLWLFNCCNTKLKKTFFFEKIFVFFIFTKYALFAEKKNLYGKKFL